MRIAIFTEVFVPKIDGITNRLANTIRCMRDSGHEVLVFAPMHATREFEGVRVVRIPGIGFPGYPDLQISSFDPRIAWELFRFAPDIVHAVGPVLLGTWGMLTATALRLPIVASYHTDLPSYAPLHGLGLAKKAVWPLIRAVHELAHLNLCPSSATRDELEAHGIGGVEIWRGGVDKDLFHPAKRSNRMRARLSGGRPDKPILLSVGRLSAEKRLDTLIPVLDAHPDAHLAIVGDGPDRERLECLFRNRNASFTGFLSGMELASAFASADLFLMPSTTETLGFVVLEAMSAGCPVIAARAGGIPDLVCSGENGLLYDPEDTYELVESVGKLLEDRGQRRFYALHGRKLAEESSWKNETRKLVWRYRGVIERHRRRSLLRKVLGAARG